jgi:RNA 2',3'-cyclic 3'-phosphodiesterase
MRTFIAIDLPTSLKTQLEALQSEIRTVLDTQGGDRALNWVQVPKIHVTLRFLGDTNDRQSEQIGWHLQRIAQDQPPFVLNLAGIGVFPNWPRMRILWIGVGGEVGPLKKLQAEVEKSAQACGFAAEDKEFSPHITLARVDRNATNQHVRTMGESLRSWSQTKGNRTLGTWRVDEMIHMRSQLQPSGAIYTPLRHFRFGAEH